MHSHLNFDRGVQLVFCSLSPYDEVLGDFSVQKTGCSQTNIAFKIYGQKHLDAQLHRTIYFEKHSCWRVILVVLVGDWWRKQLVKQKRRESVSDDAHPVDKFTCPPSIWGCGMFEMSLLRITHFFWYAHFRNVLKASGLVWPCSSSVCLHVDQHWFQYRIVPVSLLIVRWFALCTWLYHAASFLVACSCWSKKGYGTHVGVSINRGTPKSSILIGCSLINHPLLGTPIEGSPHVSLPAKMGSRPAVPRILAIWRIMSRPALLNLARGRGDPNMIQWSVHGWIIYTWLICKCQDWQYNQLNPHFPDTITIDVVFPMEWPARNNFPDCQ